MGRYFLFRCGYLPIRHIKEKVNETRILRQLEWRSRRILNVECAKQKRIRRRGNVIRICVWLLIIISFGIIHPSTSPRTFRSINNLQVTMIVIGLTSKHILSWRSLCSKTFANYNCLQFLLHVIHLSRTRRPICTFPAQFLSVCPSCSSVARPWLITRLTKSIFVSLSLSFQLNFHSTRNLLFAWLAVCRRRTRNQQQGGFAIGVCRQIQSLINIWTEEEGFSQQKQKLKQQFPLVVSPAFIHC